MKESRKIYLSGGNSYVITLPKRWVENNGLKSGDYVTVEDYGEYLVVRAKEIKRAKRVVNIDAKSLTHDSLIRRIVAHYLAGYDTIRVRIYNEEQRRAISLASDMLVGAEVIEDLGREIVVEIFVDHRFSLEHIIEKIGRMCVTMISDFKQLLKSLDGYIYSSIVMRENEIDRLHFLALRLLKSEINKNPKDLLEFRTVVRALERIGDHCAKMSESLVKLKMPIPKMIELVDTLEDVLKLTLKAFLKKSTEVAEKVIDEVERFYSVEEKFSSLVFEFSGDKSANLRILLDSLSRIAGYCSDIAESVINMCT